MTTLVWLRQDLRLADNPALLAAVERGAVVPVYIWAPDELAPWAPGAASRWWLHHSLVSLQGELKALGSRLIVRRGPSLQTLRNLAQECDAEGVCWNRCYEPEAIERDKNAKAALREDGLWVESFKGNLLWEPWEVETKAGDPYKVFTPYYKRCVNELEEPEEPLDGPAGLPTPETWPASQEINDLGLLPKLDWADGFTDYWQPGIEGAREHLQRHLVETMKPYPDDRDRPDRWGTSRLSPHLHFGELSPREVWDACRSVAMTDGSKGIVRGEESYLRQIGWREFAHHLLYHYPETPTEPLYEKFSDFAWREDEAQLSAWQKGQTGFPIIDAGMRELWATGWMHNRVRMLVGSFLVKDLRIHWLEGAKWFWDTLVDADLANNTLGWQWVGGCGADAAPYFRVFNPMTQTAKFDPNGDYIHKWVPELANVPSKYIHEPWKAPLSVLEEAGVTLGKQYPEPIVDHAKARQEALAAYQDIK